MGQTENIYEELPPDFYETSLSQSNPITQYYHRNRYGKIRKFIAGRYKKGMRMADFGCGSSSWNTGKLPVTGVDINRTMLEFGKRQGFISEGIVGDFTEQKLPLPDGSFDLIVISEVLEHIDNPEKAVNEARRLLRDGGWLIVTVPLDTPLSPWSVLFGIGCFIRGDLLGNEYYKKRCGHVQHFSVDSISRLLESGGFAVAEKDVTLMNIGIAARKIA
ncbi:MAG: class I SAM-dependent methyltransferase [Candidatus Micrarchaeota archaeon]